MSSKTSPGALVILLTSMGLLFKGYNSRSAGIATPVPTMAGIASTAETPLDVTFRGENNLAVLGLFYHAPQSPALTLILLNFRTRWADWAPKWRARGFNVVAIDELIYNVGGLLDETNKLDLRNLQLVIDQLNTDPDVIPHQFAILGGSLMGGYALVGCALSPDCKTAILLSPTDTVERLGLVKDPLAALGKRPILIVASKGETGIVDTAQDYDKRALGEHQLILYDWGYHASAMFYAHPELVDTVGDWLAKYLARGSEATPPN